MKRLWIRGFVGGMLVAGIAHEIAPAAAQLTPKNIVRMVKLRVSKAAVLMAIRSSGTRFGLRAADVIALHKARVPLEIIDAMLDTDRAQPDASAAGVDPRRRADAEIEADRQRRLEEQRREEEKRRREDEEERKRSEERRKKREAELKSEGRR
jgi:hypothetical protein